MIDPMSQQKTANSARTLSAKLRASPRLRMLAPWVWWFVFIAVILMNLLAIAPTFQFWQRECVSGDCNDQQLRLFLLRSWLAMGLTRETYALVAICISWIPVVAYMAVGFVLFRAKPHDRMVYLTSLTLVLFGGVTYGGTLSILARANSLWWYPVLLFDFLGAIGIIAFFFIFPNGQFVPRWTRLLFGFFVLEEFLELLNNPPVNWRFLPSFFVDGVFLFTIASIVFAQLYRYRRVSNANEQRQTKWVVYSTSIALIGFVIAALVFLNVPALNGSVLAEVGLTLILALLISAIPISIAIAMLRARLWDIDLIINRTLLYGALTAILAGILAVTSDLAKRFFLALTGESSELAPIAATLLVVALFDPVRKRLGELIDRHFKYSTRGLGAFGEQLRAYVELNDAEALARRFLQEIISAYGANGGAVSFGEASGRRVIATQGNWDGIPALGVPLEYNGVTVGLVELTARQDGDAYEQDAQSAIQQDAALVAHALQLALRGAG